MEKRESARRERREETEERERGESSGIAGSMTFPNTESSKAHLLFPSLVRPDPTALPPAFFRFGGPPFTHTRDIYLWGVSTRALCGLWQPYLLRLSHTHTGLFEQGLRWRGAGSTSWAWARRSRDGTLPSWTAPPKGEGTDRCRLNKKNSACLSRTRETGLEKLNVNRAVVWLMVKKIEAGHSADKPRFNRARHLHQNQNYSGHGIDESHRASWALDFLCHSSAPPGAC